MSDSTTSLLNVNVNPVISLLSSSPLPTPAPPPPPPPLSPPSLLQSSRLSPLPTTQLMHASVPPRKKVLSDVISKIYVKQSTTPLKNNNNNESKMMSIMKQMMLFKNNNNNNNNTKEQDYFSEQNNSVNNGDVVDNADNEFENEVKNSTIKKRHFNADNDQEEEEEEEKVGEQEEQEEIYENSQMLLTTQNTALYDLLSRANLKQYLHAFIEQGRKNIYF